VKARDYEPPPAPEVLVFTSRFIFLSFCLPTRRFLARSRQFCGFHTLSNSCTNSVAPTPSLICQTSDPCARFREAFVKTRPFPLQKNVRPPASMFYAHQFLPRRRSILPSIFSRFMLFAFSSSIWVQARPFSFFCPQTDLNLVATPPSVPPTPPKSQPVSRLSPPQPPIVIWFFPFASAHRRSPFSQPDVFSV